MVWTLGRGFACCVLLAACPNNDDNTGASAGTTTGTATADVTSDVPPTSTTGDATTESPTSGTTDGGGALADCQTQYTERLKRETRGCMCLVEVGDFPDVQTCLDAFGLTDLGPCVCPILSADPANDAHLACVAAVEVAYTACSAPLACGDVEGLKPCSEAYYPAINSCGEPTKQSFGQKALQCEGAPPFMCGSGEAVPELFTCDMAPDCVDMSDEAKELCLFTCGSGETIPKESTCDDLPDCMDMSDETKELCVFVCGDGQEIPKIFVCDNQPDCMDGSDEAMCLVRPRPLAARAAAGKRAKGLFADRAAVGAEAGVSGADAGRRPPVIRRHDLKAM